MDVCVWDREMGEYNFLKLKKCSILKWDLMVEYLNGWRRHIPQMLAISITSTLQVKKQTQHDRVTCWLSYTQWEAKLGLKPKPVPPEAAGLLLCSAPLTCCSVSKSCPTLWPHGLQHARLPCPSLSPGVCSDSHPLSQWCHPTISSSAAHFSSRPQPFPASGSFPVSWLFTSGGQSIGASASVFPMTIQGQFPLGLTGLISLLSKDSQESSPAPRF